MLIRQFTEKDRNEVIELWKICGLIRAVNNPSKDIDRKVSTNPELFLVAENDQKVVGTVMVGYDGHRGWINYLGVHPDYRRQKIGTSLMERAEQLLLKLNCPKINLQVRESNLQVVKFYEKIGFSKDEVVSMGKRLIKD